MADTNNDLYLELRAADWRKRVPIGIATSSFSDLANASRIADGLEHPLVATPAGFFTLVNRHWLPADHLVHREAALLGQSIRQEGQDCAADSNRGPWKRWARRSEMKPRMDAAVEILRRLLMVEHLGRVRID